jgi:cation diffusion facilitator family transporter
VHTHRIEDYGFAHDFGQAEPKPAERVTLWVVAITAATMIAEIAGGIWTGSIALLGDGIHMGTHVLAIGLSLAAYVVARRYALDRRFSFGTGKFGALAGYTSALLLAVAALFVVWEAIGRFLAPQPIAFAQALLVAVIGLVVNLVCALLLHRSGDGHHHHHHSHAHDHHDHQGHPHAHHHDDHGHPDAHPVDQSADKPHGHGSADLNLRAALIHVLADALTSVAAIVALVVAWFTDAAWLDPAIAIIACGVIFVWSYGLIRDSAKVLMDSEAPAVVRDAVVVALEGDGDTRVADLHIWSVGPGVLTMVASVVADAPASPDAYRSRLPSYLGILHPIIEVRRCIA